MTDEIAAITEWLGEPDMEQVLQFATTPEQTQHVESVSAAAIAYYREQHDYESLIDAWRVYVLARRRTTELYMQEWQGNKDVTLEQIGFTKMQWNRRVKEYEIEMDKLNAYFDECVSNGWNPSIAGLLKASGAGGEGDGFTQTCNKLRAAAVKLKSDYFLRLDAQQIRAVDVVLSFFREAS